MCDVTMPMSAAAPGRERLELNNNNCYSNTFQLVIFRMGGFSVLQEIRQEQLVPINVIQHKQLHTCIHIMSLCSS